MLKLNKYDVGLLEEVIRWKESGLLTSVVTKRDLSKTIISAYGDVAVAVDRLGGDHLHKKQEFLKRIDQLPHANLGWNRREKSELHHLNKIIYRDSFIQNASFEEILQFFHWLRRMS